MTTTDTPRLSMTTRVLLGASALRSLAPHLHGLALTNVSFMPTEQDTYLRVTTKTITEGADLIDRLRNDPSCTPGADDGELFTTATHTHLSWDCEWDGYPLHVSACELLTNDHNGSNDLKE